MRWVADDEISRKSFLLRRLGVTAVLVNFDFDVSLSIFCPCSLVDECCLVFTWMWVLPHSVLHEAVKVLHRTLTSTSHTCKKSGFREHKPNMSTCEWNFLHGTTKAVFALEFFFHGHMETNRTLFPVNFPLELFSLTETLLMLKNVRHRICCANHL